MPRPRLRGKLGESLASVQKYDALPENVTTSSLEALQAYALGDQTMDVANDYAAAIPLFQSAISLDPKFAMAYLRLAQSYQPLSRTRPAVPRMLARRTNCGIARARAKSWKFPCSTRLSSREILRRPALRLSHGHKPIRGTRIRRFICGSSYTFMGDYEKVSTPRRCRPEDQPGQRQ